MCWSHRKDHFSRTLKVRLTATNELVATSAFMLEASPVHHQSSHTLIRGDAYFFFSSGLGAGTGKSVNQSCSVASTTNRW